MTKEEVYKKFYNNLSDSERAAGPAGLPDFVVNLSFHQKPLNEKELEWVRKVAEKLDETE